MTVNNFNLACFTLNNNSWSHSDGFTKFKCIDNGFEYKVVDETLEIDIVYSVLTTPINKKIRVVISREGRKQKIVLDVCYVSDWVTRWINEDYAIVYRKTLYKDELIIDEAIFTLIDFAESDYNLFEDYECSSFKEYIEELWVNLLPNKEQVLTAYTKTFVSNYCQNSKKEYTLDEIENLLWAKYKYSIKEFLSNKYNK